MWSGPGPAGFHSASAQPGAAACTDPWSPSIQLSSHRCLNLDPLGSSHEQDCRPAHEETVLDYPGNPVQKDLEAGGILDPVHMKVQEIMPALRLEDVSPPLPKDSLTTQFLNPACGASPPERHYLDRQRHRMTQDRSPLRVIHDDDELPSRDRHDLFSQERTAAALDEIELRINLIGAVDRQVDRPGILSLKQRNAVVSRQLCSFQGSGHPSNAQPCSDPLAQRQNHEFRSRAGAQADYHPPADI